MAKPLRSKPYLAKLNKFTETEVMELTSTAVDDTALAIFKWEGSKGITIIRFQRNIRFDIPFDPSGSKWQAKCSKFADKDFDTSEFHQDMWNL
jgi:hypothetical protein